MSLYQGTARSASMLSNIVWPKILLMSSPVRGGIEKSAMSSLASGNRGWQWQGSASPHWALTSTLSLGVCSSIIRTITRWSKRMELCCWDGKTGTWYLPRLGIKCMRLEQNEDRACENGLSVARWQARSDVKLLISTIGLTRTFKLILCTRQLMSNLCLCARSVILLRSFTAFGHKNPLFNSVILVYIYIFLCTSNKKLLKK